MTNKLIMVALGALSATSAVADTIAWYHFDEYEPGVQLTQETKTAVKDSVTGGSANAYVTVGSSADSKWTHSEYMPCYDNPVRGTTVYDPVSKETYRQKLTNSGFLPDGYRTKKNADGWYEVCEKLGLGLFIR